MQRPLSSASKAVPSCSGLDSRLLLSAGRDLRRGRSSARGAVQHSATHLLIPAGPGTAPDARPRCGLQLLAAARHRLPALPSWEPKFSAWEARAEQILLLSPGVDAPRAPTQAGERCSGWPQPCVPISSGFSLNIQFIFIFSSTVTTLNSPMMCHCQASAFSLRRHHLHIKYMVNFFKEIEIFSLCMGSCQEAPGEALGLCWPPLGEVAPQQKGLRARRAACRISLFFFGCTQYLSVCADAAAGGAIGHFSDVYWRSDT